MRRRRLIVTFNRGTGTYRNTISVGLSVYVAAGLNEVIGVGLLRCRTTARIRY